MGETVYTIGHSTHPQPYFLELLRRHGITALCDVRSQPYSRVNPQFNREELKKALRNYAIQYVFLGKELGARSEDPSCHLKGRIDFARLAKTGLFREGLERVQKGMKEFRIALMCAEKEPLECHRTILVARHLIEQGIDVQHIHADGQLETNAAAMNRLRQMLRLPEDDLFRSTTDVLADAYGIQGARIAYEVTPEEIPEAAPISRGAAG